MKWYNLNITDVLLRQDTEPGSVVQLINTNFILSASFELNMYTAPLSNTSFQLKINKHPWIKFWTKLEPLSERYSEPNCWTDRDLEQKYSMIWCDSYFTYALVSIFCAFILDACLVKNFCFCVLPGSAGWVALCT